MLLICPDLASTFCNNIIEPGVFVTSYHAVSYMQIEIVNFVIMYWYCPTFIQMKLTPIGKQPVKKFQPRNFKLSIVTDKDFNVI